MVTGTGGSRGARGGTPSVSQTSSGMNGGGSASWGEQRGGEVTPRRQEEEEGEDDKQETYEERQVERDGLKQTDRKRNAAD